MWSFWYINSKLYKFRLSVESKPNAHPLYSDNNSWNKILCPLFCLSINLSWWFFGLHMIRSYRIMQVATKTNCIEWTHMHTTCDMDTAMKIEVCVYYLPWNKIKTPYNWKFWLKTGLKTISAQYWVRTNQNVPDYFV